MCAVMSFRTSGSRLLAVHTPQGMAILPGVHRVRVWRDSDGCLRVTARKGQTALRGRFMQVETTDFGVVLHMRTETRMYLDTEYGE